MVDDTKAPLSPHFMLTSIIGFFISVLTVYPRWPDFGFTFALFFMLMFIASIISMTKTAVPYRHHLDMRYRK